MAQLERCVHLALGADPAHLVEQGLGHRVARVWSWARSSGSGSSQHIAPDVLLERSPRLIRSGMVIDDYPLAVKVHRLGVVDRSLDPARDVLARVDVAR